MAQKKKRSGWRMLIVAVLIAMGVRGGIAQAYVVDGPSMEPSLVDAQRLLVLRAAYGLSLPWRTEALTTWAMPAVGDVVVIESPTDGLDLVKRVVGLPGDMIEVRDGLLVRNGERVSIRLIGACVPERHIRFDPGCRVMEERVGERRWTVSRSVLSPLADSSPTIVPAGRVYLLGDHRDRSNDSRAIGPVPVSHLRGRVLFAD